MHAALTPPLPDDSRYEHKYLVRPSRAAALRTYLEAFMRRDAYCAHGPYGVYSLYLDSPDHALWWATEEGRRNRFKLRVRAYSADDEVVFLETKHRRHRIVQKERVAIRRDKVERPSNEEHVARFRALQSQTAAEPACWVYYEREAFADDAGIRVSFDTELRCAWADGYRMPASPPRTWQPVPLRYDVVEIKSRGPVPGVLANAIQRFDLERISLSKYAMAMRSLRGRFSLYGIAV